jgi:phosphoribosylformylglycinamidine (FGAM) synthase-like enzyme
MDGPTDGAVLLVDPESPKALSVTHGIYPRYSDCDTYDMAMCAVDEAYRAHIALGGHPDQAAALDNFCWPDPILSEACPDGPYKMAQLVRANQGLRKACMDYGLPLISGKDSMKNDAVLDGKKVSIRPTLLISLMGILEDRDKAMTTDFLRSGRGHLYSRHHKLGPRRFFLRKDPRAKI